MHIVLAGCGKVGGALVELLVGEGHSVTVIDADRDVLGAIVERCDVITVHGNCALTDTLEDARIDTADVLITATASDEVNLLTCAVAHKLNERLHTVARIRNPEYDEQIFRMRDVFSLSHAFNPEKQTATEIGRLLKYPGFLKRDTFAKGRLEIVELRIERDSRLCNIALNMLDSIVRCRVLICAVLRDGVPIIPDGSFVLREGDRIFFTAASNDLTAVFKSLGLSAHRSRRVMIVGGSKLSIYLAEELAEQGLDVTLIEKDAERCAELAAALPRTDIICADAAVQSTLAREGLDSCDALISLTGSDELNILLALYAGGFRVPQIITKLARVSDLHIVDRLPLGSIVCPQKLCCNSIVRYVRAVQQREGAALTVHAIADGQAEACEFRVDAATRHRGTPLKKIPLKGGIRLAGISHEGKTTVAGGESVYVEGDTVVVVSTRDDRVLELNDIFAV